MRNANGAKRKVRKSVEVSTSRIFGMQLPAELDAALTQAASRHNLTKSGIARMALARGLSLLNEQLTQP